MRSTVMLTMVATLAGCAGDPAPGAEPDAMTMPPDADLSVRVLADNESFPNGIVTDGVDAWWVAAPEPNGNQASIRTMNLASGEVRELSSGAGEATFLRHDADEVYFADSLRTIRAVSKTTGASRLVVTRDEDGFYFDLDYLDGRIYWTAGTGAWSARKDGSDVQPLATLAGSATLGVEVDDERVFMLTTVGVEAVAKTGGTATTLLDLPIGMNGNLADGPDHVFVSDRSTASGRVLRLRKIDPPGTFITLATDQANPGRMVSNGWYVYWVNRPTEGTGAVMRMLTEDGGFPEVIADGLDVPADLALHNGWLLWTVNGRQAGDGAVMAGPPFPPDEP